MTTKEKLLTFLESHKGAFYSGEELAGTMNVSRTAIWKAIKSLQKEGYEIEAVPNKGYCLSADTDIISLQGLKQYLSSERQELPLEVYGLVDSTNTMLRERANQGALEGTIIVAGAQSKGRGRLGRQFYSPQDTGVYMSILLRPARIPTEKAVHITTIAAVAACEAIEGVTGKKAMIKWVNDVFMEGKKVSGILTEASISMENLGLEYIIMGIGLNVYAPEGGFPEEIAQVAGSILEDPMTDGKNRIAAAFIDLFLDYYDEIENGHYVERYRERSLAIGRVVKVLKKDGDRMALVLDVDEDCHLLVKYEDDGSMDTLSSGEISIRL